MMIIHSFLMLLQLPTSNRCFISHGYSAAEAAGLRGAALNAGLRLRFAMSYCPVKGQYSFFVLVDSVIISNDIFEYNQCPIAITQNICAN